MSSSREPRRRARGEERPQRPPAEARFEDADQVPSSARSFRAGPRAPAIEGLAPDPAYDGPRLDKDDLMAIAQMDPAELAALMEDTVRRNRLEVGTKVAGLVTRVDRETVFVDIGGKSEGQIERHEVPEVKLGDEVTSYVVGMEEGGVTLSMHLTGRAASEHLEEALESGLPVEGKVHSRNPGGFEVRIGTARAFCPTSLMSRLPEVDMDAYVGQTLQFRVVETGEKVVVNRRVIQEEEASKKADALRGTLVVGQQHRGIVRNVQAFGFFVDIGGIDGLVPKREISWRGVDDPRTAVRVGQAVEVVILDIDHQNRKLTLSAKALEDDPWTAIDVAFHEGGIYKGTVLKAEPFGLFVELAPGLSGLMHVSKLGGGAPEVGKEIEVRLVTVDRERRRLELAPVTAGEVSAAPSGDGKLRGTVAEVVKNGVVVQLDDGRTGWIPEGEVELPSGTVLAQRFRRGKAIEARIVKDDPKRPILSLRDATTEEERSWKTHQAQSRGGQPSQGRGGTFGTLGDLLGGLNLKK